MRRILCFLTISLATAIALGASPTAQAQDTPKVEVFGGYSFMRANVVTSGQAFSLNGGSGSVAYNVNNWFGLVGDLGAYHQGNVGANGFSLTVVSYMFGPRISWRWHNPDHPPITPFAQVLLGGGHASGTLYTQSLGPGLAPLGTSNGFALTTGGGVDWRLYHQVAIRIFQAEYFHTQFLNGSNDRQNNFRLSSGIVFSFGKR